MIVLQSSRKNVELSNPGEVPDESSSAKARQFKKQFWDHESMTQMKRQYTEINVRTTDLKIEEEDNEN